MNVRVESPVPVPAYDPQTSNEEKELYPSTLTQYESEEVGAQECQTDEIVTCEFWWQPDYEGDTTSKTYPCGYYQTLDVCWGSFACECSTGYWRRTQPILDTIPEVIEEEDESFLSDVNADTLDPDTFPEDETLLKLVAMTAGGLLVLCSIPCVVCACCCGQRGENKIGCAPVRRMS